MLQKEVEDTESIEYKDKEEESIEYKSGQSKYLV